MRIRVAAGAWTVAAAVALTGCSGGKSGAPSQGQAQNQTPGQVRGQASTTSTPSDGTTPVADASPLSPLSPSGVSAPSQAEAGAKPVSALLAKLDGPITTASMPKAEPAWIAAVQHTDDTGREASGLQGISLNLIALVDEAAKTSDLDALVKMCNLCDQHALRQKLTATDRTGLTGFQELSRVLEKTHPAPAHMVGVAWDFPGFTSPGKGAATTLDQQDIALLGGDPQAYDGIRAQFATLNDGADPYSGWTGIGAPGT